MRSERDGEIANSSSSIHPLGEQRVPFVDHLRIKLATCASADDDDPAIRPYFDAPDPVTSLLDSLDGGGYIPLTEPQRARRARPTPGAAVSRDQFMVAMAALMFTSRIPSSSSGAKAFLIKAKSSICARTPGSVVARVRHIV